MADNGNGSRLQGARSKSVTLIDPQDDTEDNGGAKQRGNVRQHYHKPENDEDYSDEEREQTTPMMPRGGATAFGVGQHQAAAQTLGSHLSGAYDQSYKPDEMDVGPPPKQPSPTGKLAWAGFGLAVFSLTCMCLSFASPYWIQQWPLSFSTFQNMGLWEVCFHNYMHHRDDMQEIYNGCFWVFDTSEKYHKLRDWLLPPWFLACQVMATGILLIEVAVVLVTAFVFLHLCPIMNHEYHQIFAMFISGAMMFLCTMTALIVAILFGHQTQDRNWMPRPDWNFLSWGFGFLIISAMMAFASGFCLFWAASKSYNKLLRLQDDYFKQAMDVSQMYPANYSQASYGPGYSDKPSDTDQPSYTSQPSYEKEPIDKPSYGASQASYGPSQASYEPSEKVRYGQQRSYDDGQYAMQPSIAQAPRPGRGAQPGYDGNRSYDSQHSYDDQAFSAPVSYNQQHGQPRMI